MSIKFYIPPHLAKPEFKEQASFVNCEYPLPMYQPDTSRERDNRDWFKTYGGLHKYYFISKDGFLGGGENSYNKLFSIPFSGKMFIEGYIQHLKTFHIYELHFENGRLVMALLKEAWKKMFEMN